MMGLGEYIDILCGLELITESSVCGSSSAKTDEISMASVVKEEQPYAYC